MGEIPTLISIIQGEKYKKRLRPAGLEPATRPL